MKKILLALIFISALFVLNIKLNPLHAECFLFDGTYIGAAKVTIDGKKYTWPLFIVVANQHITGIFAPENQKHTLGGYSFNLGGLTASSNYTLSLTTDGNILIKSTDGKINGKAKLGTVEGGSSSFSGYYNSDIAGEFLPGDFLNIGSDGAVTLKVAISENKVVHAFGKIDPSGEFVQVFSEKGMGPHVKMTISGNSADIEVTLNGDSSTTTLTKFSENTCGSNNSSSGETPSNKPAFVNIFLGALNNLSLLSSTDFPDAESELRSLQDTIRKIKLALLSSPPECNGSLKTLLTILPIEIAEVKSYACGGNIASCNSTEKFTLIGIGEDLSDITDNGSLDENSNKISDICEQDSIFSEKEGLSIVSTTFNNALKDIEVYSKIARKEITKSPDKTTNTNKLSSSISRSLKKVRAVIKTPTNICQLSIKGDIEELTKSINNASILCVTSCSDALRDALEKLSVNNDLINHIITIDSNKNEIFDVCE